MGLPVNGVIGLSRRGVRRSPQEVTLGPLRLANDTHLNPTLPSDPYLCS